MVSIAGKSRPSVHLSNCDSDCDYEELAHTSEIGVRLRADAAGDLFICAARAMFHLIQPGSLTLADTSEKHEITLSAYDSESLLVDWLSELLYLYETTGLVFCNYELVNWEPTCLEATATGYRPNERPAMHIKAVTYHQLELTRKADNWQAQVFFDI